MTVAPARYCTSPGCSHYQPCPDHGRRARDRRRGSSAARGYDANHRKRREVVLSRDPICKLCGRAASTVADHIVPISAGGAPDDLDNYQGVCKPCHDRKTALEDGGFVGKGRGGKILRGKPRKTRGAPCVHTGEIDPKKFRPWIRHLAGPDRGKDQVCESCGLVLGPAGLYSAGVTVYARQDGDGLDVRLGDPPAKHTPHCWEVGR